MKAARLYFQDMESYRQSVRYDSATPGNPNFQVQTDKGINHILEYERALEQLTACSLRRKKALR